MTSTTTLDWTAQLSEQLEWHWHGQLRPRFEGLTDDEYFWEPAQPAWNVRPRTGEGQPGTGPFTVDFAFPEPDPPPVTTIAWRLAHIIVGVLGARVASHFGGPPVDYGSYAYAGTAAGALAQLDEAYARWTAGVHGLDAAALARPCGLGGGPVRRLPDGSAGTAHQPGGDPPRGRDRAAARPLPGPVRRRGVTTLAVRRSGPTRPARRRTGGRRPAPPGRRRRPAAPTPHATSRTAAGRRAGRSPPARGRRLR